MDLRSPRQLLKVLAITLAVLLVFAFSPLTDSDTGWRNAVGDVVWTAMFVVFAGIVATGIWMIATKRSSAS